MAVRTRFWGAAAAAAALSLGALLPLGGAEPAPPAPAQPAGASGGERDAPAMRRPTLFELLDKGGPVMYAIYAASVIALAFTIERAASLRRSRVLPPGFVGELRASLARRPIDRAGILLQCEADPSPIARVIQAAVKRLHQPLSDIERAVEDAGIKEARLMRRNTRVLAAIASIGPLLGLLGTVFGIISAFQEIAGTESSGGRTELLATGIYEALVATAAGLVLAIPALALYHFFAARIEKLVAELDAVAMEFIDAIPEAEKSASAPAYTEPTT